MAIPHKVLIRQRSTSDEAVSLSLTSARKKLEGNQRNVPRLPIEKLPSDPNDNEWMRIEAIYNLEFREVLALKNTYCTASSEHHNSNKKRKTSDEEEAAAVAAAVAVVAGLSAVAVGVGILFGLFGRQQKKEGDGNE